MVFLDTHALVFLYERRVAVFVPRASPSSKPTTSCTPRSAGWSSPCFSRSGASVSAGRNPRRASVRDAFDASDERFEAVVAESLALIWTRDPFDRLIVATAALNQAPLITRDRRIQEHYARSVW